jgi:hypothetical protein
MGTLAINRLLHALVDGPGERDEMCPRPLAQCAQSVAASQPPA